jgi:hyperosmotically inducible periplasmic protein
MNTKLPRLGLFLFTGILFLNVVSCGVKDSTISEAITEKAQTTPELASIRAAVNDGVVTLTGECKDDAAKQAVENAVKDIKGVKSVVNNCTITPPPAPAPVVISPDEELNKSVTDAIKDYPSVKASVQDGVITLTGDLKRSSLQKLMMSLNTLKPKKIVNQLTLK